MTYEDIKIPDIGAVDGVDVIQVLVSVGDTVTPEMSLVTLESDKASMEIPSPIGGVVDKIHIQVGDKVSEGHLIMTLKTDETTTLSNADAEPQPAQQTAAAEKVEKTAPVSAPEKPETQTNSTPLPAANIENITASPAVRRLARVLDISLSNVVGTGRKSRVTADDLEQHVKQKLTSGGSNTGFALPAAPVVDFNLFGCTELKPLNKIKRLTGRHVHRSWLTIPHVTHFDEADISELELFRQAQNARSDVKLTVLAFMCKVVSKALEAFPLFNTSLDSSAENLIFKQYFNIGIAVETPNGLVVPVIRNVDRLSVSDIAREMSRMSTKAREKGLMPDDMAGGCFTISSLGGIGGIGFTPIVNSPEVAILGLSRSAPKPVYNGEAFVPRLILPLSLSYDHRVIDGAEAARFTRYIAEMAGDIRRILV